MEGEQETKDEQSGESASEEVKEEKGNQYRIVYNRDGCIGAGVCAAVAEKHWVMNQDGKADLVDANKEEKEGKEQWVREIEESELDVNKQAAEGCPALVIHIYNKETGEKII